MTTSCLDTTSKRTVKQLAYQLGGHVVSDWRKDCTLLVMSSLSITIKASFCLPHGNVYCSPLSNVSVKSCLILINKTASVELVLKYRTIVHIDVVC